MTGQYAEERGLEGREDTAPFSRQERLNEWSSCFDVEVSIELRSDSGRGGAYGRQRLIPAGGPNVSFSMEWEDLWSGMGSELCPEGPNRSS